MFRTFCLALQHFFTQIELQTVGHVTSYFSFQSSTEKGHSVEVKIDERQTERY